MLKELPQRFVGSWVHYERTEGLEVNESYGGFEYRRTRELRFGLQNYRFVGEALESPKETLGIRGELIEVRILGSLSDRKELMNADGVIGITSGNVSNGRLPYLGMGEVSAVPMDRIKTGWIQEDKLARGGFWEGERLHASSQQF
ncbi:hypothetical protein BC829DRAFT_422880 [Chytridium lagenaria]|nr:hypothetical protein BC829DRAFT_422880 [Chytridium lagenaria]